MMKILATLGLLLVASAAAAQTPDKKFYISATLTGSEVFEAGLIVCDLTTDQCAYADGTTAFSALTKFASGGGGPHASTHSAGQSDEVLGENLGTACTAGQIWKSDGDGTMSCAADAGSGGGSNLGVAPTTTQVEITNDGGTNATITEATGAAAGVMTTTMHDRLDSTLTADGVNAYDITTDSQTASFTPAVSACPVAKVTISSGAGNFTLNAPTGTAPTGHYQCVYVVDNQSGASRNIVFAGVTTGADRLVEFALPNGAESDPIVLYTDDTGTTWRYDGGALDLSALTENATPANDDLVLCQDISDNPDTWKQCRVDALAQVSRDPAPSLTGNLDLNENFIAVTQAASPVGWLGNFSTDFAVVYAEETPGGAPSDNIGLLLSDDGVHSYGQVKMEDLVHTDAGGRIVYTAEDGTLFSVRPVAPGWSATDTDTGTFDLGTGATTGPWVDVDLDVNTVSDIEIGDRIDITWTLFIENSSSNRRGSIDIGFSVDGGAVQPGNSVGLPEYFNGYKTGSISTSASSAFAAGTNISLFARRQSGSHSSFNPIVQGSGGTNTHEMFVSVPSGGTLPTSDRQVLGSHSDHTTNVTVTAADHGTTIVCNNAGGMTVTVDDGTPDWTPDYRVYVLNEGTGDCTIQSGTATVNVASGFSAALPSRYTATIVGQDANDVTVSGGPSTGGGGGGLQDVVDDTTPQLGGDLDVNGNKITSAADGNVDLQADGTGKVRILDTAGNPLTIDLANLTVGRTWTPPDADFSGQDVTLGGTLDYLTLSAEQLIIRNAIDLSTDTTGLLVASAGALLDSEVTNLAQVKAFDTTDYATALQGTTADSALQPGDVDDTPVNGATTAPASSNWAYDHENDECHRRSAVTETGSNRTNVAADFCNQVDWTNTGAKTFTIDGNVASAGDVWFGTNNVATGNLTLEAGTNMTFQVGVALVFEPGESYYVFFRTATTARVVGGGS